MNALWWWIDRWRKSTAYTDMTLEEQGAYRNLLDEAQLRGGAIPNDERILAKACGDATRWRKVRTAVLERFTLTADGWRNETLDKVISESQRRAKKQQRYRDRHRNNDGNVTGNGAGLSGGVTNHQSPITEDHSQKPVSDLRARLAFGGKVLEVPKFLDADFQKQLNGQHFDLTAFYVALDQRLAQTGERWDLRWIREQFNAEAPQPERRKPERFEKPFTAQERQEAERVRRNVWQNRCRHEPVCETAAGCVATIIHGWRTDAEHVA